MMKELHGEESLKVIDLRAKLATAYFSMGNYEAAEAIFREVIDRFREVYGDDIFGPYDYVAYLAETLLAMEDYEAALLFAREDLEICRKVFGDYHARIADSLNRLSNVYRYMGDLEKADRDYDG